MLEARLNQASILKKLLDAVKELVQDANFECNDDGISLQAMDNSHVALVSVMLKASGFENYRCDRSMPLGINLASLTKILKCANDSDIVTLKAADDADSLGLMFEAHRADRVGEYEIKLMDIDQEHLGIPDTSYDAEVVMSSGEFQKICRDLTVLGESVKIEVTKEGVRFSAEGEIGAGSVFLKPTSVGKIKAEVKDEDDEEDDEDAVKVKTEKKDIDDDDDDEVVKDDDEEAADESEIEIDEDEVKPALKKRKTANGSASPTKKGKKPKKDEEEEIGVQIRLSQAVSLTFSLKYLQNFAKSAPLASKVSLQLMNEIPLLVGFEFEQGYIKYYLAPKIGEE